MIANYEKSLKPDESLATVYIMNGGDSKSDDEWMPDFGDINTDDSAEPELLVAEPEKAGGKVVGADKRHKKLEDLRIAFGNTMQIAAEIKANEKDPMFVAFANIVNQGLAHIKKWKGAIQ